MPAPSAASWPPAAVARKTVRRAWARSTEGNAMNTRSPCPDIEVPEISSPRFVPGRADERGAAVPLTGPAGHGTASPLTGPAATGAIAPLTGPAASAITPLPGPAVPATTRSPQSHPARPQAGTMPPVTGPGRPGRAYRTPGRLATAAAGGLLAAGMIVLAAAAASGTSPASSAGTHPVTAAYSGNARYAASTSALTQQVSYRVQQLHNPGGPGPGGPAAAVIVELLDAAGNNVSGPGITLTVTGLSPRPGPGRASGGAFTPVNLGLWPCYRLQVSTVGYPPGTYTLSFTAGTDPAPHTAQFTVP